MGCGKSKHDVVTGNTVSQSKKSKDDLSHNGTSVDGQAPPQSTTTNSSVQPEANALGNGDIGVVKGKESEKAIVGPVDGNVKQGEKAEAGQEGGKVIKESESEKVDIVDVVIKESENVNDEKAKETKVVTIAEDLKEKMENVDEIESKKVGGTVEEEQGQGKIIPSDSQSHLNDGTIESIITEGLSGTTVYYSPPHTSIKEEESPKIDNVVVEDQKESIEETKKETTNVEIVTVTEETSIKEEVIAAVETKASTNIEESEKLETATKENVAETTGEDAKTN